ncbi:LOW QUALITY PROTEIN: hypothetical protein HZS_3947 [Henneguya salminicola]|nr:LOW QUALITY PROTEIN: hypothetical protein HZS_3947 [Henneguya salminicola]
MQIVEIQIKASNHQQESEILLRKMRRDFTRKDRVIGCLKCKSCKPPLSPRTGGFLTYLDSTRRSHCKISTAKILQIVFRWITQRPIVDSIETLGLKKPTVVDWQNFCRRICQFENGIVHHTL